MTDPIFYTAELDLSLEKEREFFPWFAGRHVADLFKSGFYSCAAYRALEGSMPILDTYQAHTWDVFVSDGYRAREKDPYAKSILAGRRGASNTVYAYEPLPPDIAGEHLRPIDCDWLTLLRFDADQAGLRAVANWLKAEEIPRLRAAGSGAVRLVYRTKDRPIGEPSKRPRCALVTEWPRTPPALASLSQPLGRVPGVALPADAGFSGKRMYPWPDHGEIPSIP